MTKVVTLQIESYLVNSCTWQRKGVSLKGKSEIFSRASSLCWDILVLLPLAYQIHKHVPKSRK